MSENGNYLFFGSPQPGSERAKLLVEAIKFSKFAVVICDDDRRKRDAQIDESTAGVLDVIQADFNVSSDIRRLDVQGKPQLYLDLDLPSSQRSIENFIATLLSPVK